MTVVVVIAGDLSSAKKGGKGGIKGGRLPPIHNPPVARALRATRLATEEE